MDKERQKKALEALERQEKQYQKKNDYIKQKYDRVSVTFAKGTKDRIKAATGGGSVNAFINDVVMAALDDLEGSTPGPAADDQETGFEWLQD